MLALAGAACTGNLHPFLGPLTTRPDAAVVPDASVPIGDCPSGLVGFATMSDVGGEWDGGTTGMPTLQLDGGTTGGDVSGAGPPVVVDAADSDALAQFSMYASDKMPGPLTIVVKGIIAIPPPPDGGSGDLQKIRVSSNKTVIGANVLSNPSISGSGSGFVGGGLTLTGVSNVVIRNLVISMPNGDDAGDNVDAIHVETSHQIWIDHCDLSSNGPAADAGASFDGLIDISDGSDFVTVSWTHYHDHANTGLLGRSDSTAAAAEDTGKSHVTFDHDWYSNVTTGPRIRFGTVHVLNTFFDGVANYAIASTDGADVRIEGSYFNDVAPMPGAGFGPVTTLLDGAMSAGNVDLPSGNMFPGSGKNNLTTPDDPLTLPYAYVPDSAGSVRVLVQSCAGTGKITAPTGN